MGTVERIFQAVVFEIIALAIVIPASIIVGGFNAPKVSIVGVGLSVFAMFWNYIFNHIFDSVIGYDRLKRKVSIRITHAIGFELGMVVFTLPIMAWYLNVTWVTAAILEASFLVFILLYALVFNWAYDLYQPYQKWFS